MEDKLTQFWVERLRVWYVRKTSLSCKITVQVQKNTRSKVLPVVMSCYCFLFMAYHVRLSHCSSVMSILSGVTRRVLLTRTTGLALERRKKKCWSIQFNCLHLHVFKFEIPINKYRIGQRSYSQIRVQIIVHVQVPGQWISKQHHRSGSGWEHLKKRKHSISLPAEVSLPGFHMYVPTCAAFVLIPFDEPQ